MCYLYIQWSWKVFKSQNKSFQKGTDINIS